MKTDYQDVVKGIQEGYKRFATGTYALWYPVVMRQQIKRMLRDLEATGIRRILQIELAVKPDSDQRGMTASGLIVINPPWKLEQQMKNVLPWLHKVLVPSGIGHHLGELGGTGIIPGRARFAAPCVHLSQPSTQSLRQTPVRR
jgi:23S rRNA (adenine2030-N6)-methyltransferase